MQDGVVTVAGGEILPDPRFDDQTWHSCPVAAMWDRSLVQISEAHRAVKTGLGLGAVAARPSAALVEGVLVLDDEAERLKAQVDRDFWERHKASQGQGARGGAS